MASENKQSLLEKLVPVLLLSSIVLSFVVGVLWQKVSALEGPATTGSAKTGSVAGAQQPTAQLAPQGKLTADQVKKIPTVTNDDHIRGLRDAKVILVEYSDLQCPFCKSFHPTVQRAMAEYKGQIAWVYRHFPLYTLHPKAGPAALASECVAELGGENKFWSFADKLFEDPTNLDNLEGTAVSVGVNGPAFKTCNDAQKYKDLVTKVADGGTQAGVTGTPATFVLNNKGDAWLVSGAVPYDNLKQTIDEALK